MNIALKVFLMGGIKNNLMRRAGIFSLCAALAGCAPTPAPPPTARLITGETIAMYGTTERPLMWSHSGIVAVYGYASNGSRVDYAENVDYVVTANGIARTPGSSIYDFANYVTTLNENGTFTWVNEPRNPPFTRFLHAFVDYNAKVRNDVIPALAKKPLTQFVAAGDSITAGANTISADAYPGYPDTDGFVGRIRARFGNTASVINYGVSGTSLTSLAASLPDYLASNTPSHFVIAFGMNDHSNGMSYLAGFKADLIESVNKIKAGGSAAILVGFPRKNNGWEYYNEASIIAFNNAIKEAAAETSSPFVDIQSMFAKAKEKKTHIELFGDNYHHPGNYGQRIYLSGILPHLISTPLLASDVPDYLTLPQ